MQITVAEIGDALAADCCRFWGQRTCSMSEQSADGWCSQMLVTISMRDFKSIAGSYELTWGVVFPALSTD